MPSPPKRNEEKAEARRILSRVSGDTDLAGIPRSDTFIATSRIP